MRILSAEWILPISSEPIANGAIIINDGKIIAVGQKELLKKDYPQALSEDFGEAVIMPGFVNCHSHLELTAMRGFLDSVESDFFRWLIKLSVTRAEKLTDTDIEISATFGALEGARAGVTCFGDIGRYGKAGLVGLKNNGLRGVVFQETDFSPFNENAAEEFLKLKDKFLKLRSEETDLVKIGISPHSPYTVSRRLFEEITAYAVNENVKISIHAAESIMEENLMINGTGVMADFYQERGVKWTAPGLSSIKYLAEIGVLKARPLLAHCIRIDETDLKLIGESKSGIAHCPKSNAKFGHTAAPFEKFLDKNLCVGIGSDSVASNNICDILEESRFAILTARGREDKKRLISAKEVIEAATLGGAKAMKLEAEIGSLETGKQADLIVISLANTAQQPVHDIYAAILFASNARDIHLNMVNGREIFRENISKMVDESSLKNEMKTIARKMQGA